MKISRRLVRSFVLIFMSITLGSLSSANIVLAGDITFFGTNDIIYYDPDVCSADGASPASATNATAGGNGIYSVDNKKPSGTQFHPGDHGGLSPQGDARDPYTYPGGDSINGIKEAIRKGNYGQIDQDTRISKDGVPILLHNGSPASEGFKGPNASKDVKDLTLAQIKKLSNHGVSIATLEEVLIYTQSKQSKIIVQVEWKPNRVITEAEISTIANLYNKYGVRGAFKGGAKHKAIADSLAVAQKHGFWVRSTKDDGNGWVKEVWHAPTVTSGVSQTPGSGGAQVNITLAQANVQTPSYPYRLSQRERVAGALDKFKSNDPDFVTLNEIAPDTNTNINEYKSFQQNYPGARTREDSALRILWNSNRWKKVDGGIKLVHEYENGQTVQKQSAWNDRYALWGTFQNTSTGGVVSVISSHWTTRATFPPNHDRARTQGENLRDLSKELLAKGPVLVAGDLNFQLYAADEPYSPATLLGQAGMKPVFKKGEGSYVDWMFYSEQLKVTGKKVYPTDRSLSDHPFILGKFTGTAGPATAATTGACVCPAGDTSSGGDVPIEGNDNAEKAWNFLTGKGLSPEQAAGIMGNLSVESGFDPQADNSGNYHGIAQWDTKPGGRWERLKTWAGQQNLDPAKFETQLQYLWKEATDRKNIEGIKKYTDVPHTAWYWGRFFEVAITGGTSETPLTNVQDLTKRTSEAQKYFGKYKGTTGNATGGASTVGAACPGQDGEVGNGSEFSADGMTIYNQEDPRWASKPFGTTGKTIKSSGCGPTSMATIITALTGKKVTPDQTTAYANEKNMYVAGSGASWRLGPVLAEHWGLKSKSVSKSVAQINAELRKGALIIISGTGASPFTSSGHFITIRGVTDSGKWKIADSNGTTGQQNSKKEWDPNLILGIANDNAVAIYK